MSLLIGVFPATLGGESPWFTYLQSINPLTSPAMATFYPHVGQVRNPV